jgi:hypothetical protein
MSNTSHFKTPADIRDFDQNSHLANEWNDLLSGYFTKSISDFPPLFFDPRSPPVGQITTSHITWGGFPNILNALDTDKEEAYKKADKLALFDGNFNDLEQKSPQFFSDPNGHNTLPEKYRQQDEYLEWAVHIDDNSGKIKEIFFTCEGPEYWDVLSQDQNLLLQLYKQYASPNVALSDLLFLDDVYQKDENTNMIKKVFQSGDYNPYNKWNLSTAIHLIHPSNTLGAEITLAAQGSQLYGTTGNILSDPGTLICCAAYGEPNRNSDPTIGSIANTQARAGNWVSLRDPVGLYISGIDDSQFQKPDGSNISDFDNRYWTILRASSDNSLILRAKLSVPEGEMVDGRQMLLGDLLVNGRPLKYGAQVAEAITMGLFVITVPNGPHADINPCHFKCCSDTDHPSYEFIVDSNRNCPQAHPFARILRMNSLSRVHT